VTQFVAGFVAFVIGVTILGALAVGSVRNWSEIGPAPPGTKALMLVPIAIGLYLFTAGIRIFVHLWRGDRGSDIAASAPKTIVIADIARVFESLKSTGVDDAFMVLTPLSAAGVPDRPFNLQFSKVNHTVGFDWVLEDPTNVKHRSRFESLAKSRRHTLREITRNGVTYVRITNGDLVGLCVEILRRMYFVRDKDLIELFAEDFECPPGS